MSPALRLGQRIKEIREGLPVPTNRTKKSRLSHPSQEEFADLLKTDRWRVIEWENKGTIPDRRFREQIADIAGIPRSELEKFVDEMRVQRGEYVTHLEQRIADLEAGRKKDREEYYREFNTLRAALAAARTGDDDERHDQEEIAI